MRLNTILLFYCFLYACSSGNNSPLVQQQKQTQQQEKNPVDITILQESAFKNQLAENGKLCAIQKSTLAFGVSEALVTLPVKNGDVVQKGGVIAQLRQENLHRELGRAKAELQKANLDLQDLLIGQGYNANDTANIPTHVLEVALIRSGVLAAQREIHKAERELQQSKLIAPFSGVVADITHRMHEKVGADEDFCCLIDNSAFEVEFSVLETELGLIKTGTAISAVPFSLNNSGFKGAITEINPLVNEYGLIKVKATIKGAKGLIDGMNVKVFIENEIPGQLVVPRSAVVLRDNQEVLFKYVNGKAWWTYVQVLHENSTSYAVRAHPDKSASLQAGDTIIINNNLNLAHESEVVRK